MKEIPLTQGKVALVDDEAYERLSQWQWYAWKGPSTWYAIRNIGKYPNRKSTRMHREIVSCPSSLEVDHIDGNGLNNQLSNLRICKHTENGKNHKINKNNTTGYKGVTKRGLPYRKSEIYIVQICVNGKKRHVGCFENIIDAAKAYDKKAKELFGEFAKTNF